MALSIKAVVDAAFMGAENAISDAVDTISIENRRTTPPVVVASGDGYKMTAGATLGLPFLNATRGSPTATFIARGLKAEPREGMVLIFRGRIEYAITAADDYLDGGYAWFIEGTRITQ